MIQIYTFAIVSLIYVVLLSSRDELTILAIYANLAAEIAEYIDAYKKLGEDQEDLNARAKLTAATKALPYIEVIAIHKVNQVSNVYIARTNILRALAARTFLKSPIKLSGYAARARYLFIALYLFIVIYYYTNIYIESRYQRSRAYNRRPSASKEAAHQLVFLS